MYNVVIVNNGGMVVVYRIAMVGMMVGNWLQTRAQTFLISGMAFGRVSPLLLVLMVATVSTASAAPPSPSPPHIVLIVADDLGKFPYRTLSHRSHSRR